MASLSNIFPDLATAKHFERWLSEHVYEQEHDLARAAVSAALNDDPTLLGNRSWPEIRSLGESLRSGAARPCPFR